MLRSITWQQFQEWAMYAELEPFGEMRADYRAALIAQTIVNMNRDTKRHPRPFPLKDFLLDFEAKEPKKTDWRQMKMTAQMWAVAQESDK